MSRFSSAFQVPVGTITTTQLQQWLDGLKLAPQSIKNYRTVLHVFFEFCAARGYVHRGFNAAAHTEAVKVRGSDVET